MAEAAQQLPDEVEYELSKLELGSYAYARGVRKGREAGEEASRQAARAAILTTLHTTVRQRGIELDEASLARLEHCQDLEQLSQCLVRAATAHSPADIFG